MPSKAHGLVGMANAEQSIADALHRQLRLERLADLLVVDEQSGHLAREHAGAQRVHPDVVASPLQRQLTGESDQAGLGRDVARLREQRIRPIASRVREKGKGLEREISIPGFGDKVTTKDISVATRQLATTRSVSSISRAAIIV